MRLARIKINSITDVEGELKRFSGEIDYGGGTKETFTDREFAQQFGFSSNPEPNSVGWVLIDGEFIFLLATDNPSIRPGVESGELVLWRDNNNKISIKEAGEIVVESERNVTINSAKSISITATDDLTISITGDASITGQNVTIAAATLLKLGAAATKGVARLGDAVIVAGVPGTITSSSAKVFSE